MSNDIKLDIEVLEAMAFLGFGLHISPFLHNERMESFGTLDDITTPIIVVLETGVVPFAVLDRPGLSQLIIPVARNPKCAENVKVCL